MSKFGRRGQSANSNLENWWKDLDLPTLSPALKARVSAGVADELRSQSRRAAEAARDALLVDHEQEAAVGLWRG